MFNLDHIVRTASAAVFSLMLTTIAVGAAIGPVSPGATPAAQLAAAQPADIAHG
ncbi:MAG TPA: hypothetical protein VGB79_05170 [Allosphingosinicella sp.]|jgi:hypothetical protein